MNGQAKVTVIMPVRNEEKYITAALEAVRGQDYPKENIEILVVDGLSSDSTPDIVGKISELDPRVRLLRNEKGIASSALNIGVAAASGEVIVRVDGHCVVGMDYVSKALEKLETGAWGAGGPVETVGETFAAKAIALAMSSRFGVGDSAFRTLKDRETYADTVPFPAYPRWVFDKVGKYDEELIRNQDDEFNLRIIEMGGKIILTPEMKSIYYSRSGFYSLFRQYFGYGFYKVRVIQKHPRTLRIRHFVPGAFVAACLISPIFAFAPMGWLLPAAVYGSYFAVNLGGAVFLSLKHRFPGFLHFSLAFMCLHVGYGAGFLKGLFHFRNKWKKR